MTDLPSMIPAGLDLQDYFCINRHLRDARLHPSGVIGASGDGVVLPIITEEATTLAPRQAILVHQRTDDSVRRDLRASGSSKGAYDGSEMTPEFMQTLRSLGFDSVVWGPIEEHAWGERKATILANSKLVFECNHVGFYRFN
jgi:hypothetical protein